MQSQRAFCLSSLCLFVAILVFLQEAQLSAQTLATGHRKNSNKKAGAMRRPLDLLCAEKSAVVT
ncbi:MAG: hypothetical protein ABFS37_08235, partial [Acidobacteriota bacterium]